MAGEKNERGRRESRCEGNDGTMGGGQRDATKRMRHSSESDPDQPPAARARGGSRGGYPRSSAATGSNRIALGARQAAQQQVAA